MAARQIAVTLGAATLGTAFLALSTDGALGLRDALVAVLAVQVAVAATFAVASRRLPDPAR